MSAGGSWRGIGAHGRRSRIGGVIEMHGQRSTIATIQRFDPALTILDTIARLALRVALDPLGPTSPTMRRRDVLIEIESIAMLESHIALVDELHAWATGLRGQCCKSNDAKPNARGEATDGQARMRLPTFRCGRNPNGRIVIGVPEIWRDSPAYPPFHGIGTDRLTRTRLGRQRSAVGGQRSAGSVSSQQSAVGLGGQRQQSAVGLSGQRQHSAVGVSGQRAAVGVSRILEIPMDS